MSIPKPDPALLLAVTEFGQLRNGSPVAISVRDQPMQRGTVGQLYPPMLFGVWVRGEPSPSGRTKWGTAEVINQKWLALDLSVQTGRSHAATWAMEVTGGTLSGVLVSMLRPDLAARPTVRRGMWRTIRGAMAYLNHLDPDDERTLPDGSFVVDALALRLICEAIQ